MVRIEVTSDGDARGRVIRDILRRQGINAGVKLADVYTLDGELSQEELTAAKALLINPVTEKTLVNDSFDYALEIGFWPGVTDNVGTTVREGLASLGIDAQAYSSRLLFLSGVTEEDARKAAVVLSNPIIQRTQIRSFSDFISAGGMGEIIPRVSLGTRPEVSLVDLLGADDEELTVIGKRGIANTDGSRRGPLALSFSYMKAIQAYSARIKRNLTDIELESLAQTWSEHCKHTIFADPIDDVTEGLFRKYIRGATERIRAEKGDKDVCRSVFVDNSGAIDFDGRYWVTLKVETHNSPSALDPFGGSITGIVGVNRDAMGFGMGAKPFLNVYGFCLADPDDETVVYRDAEKINPMLLPRQILDGVVQGVNVGGNCSGIPTNLGVLSFDHGFKGKPLVYVGTMGVIPAEVNGTRADDKKAEAGDYIVMLGGRVGKDGIHGATFSSESLSSGSPATAVQIGDPITQKKMSDALIKEARDLGLYRSITDNGAGGLSCSVAEMAKESGGFNVNLDQVPLKYQGLAAWEVWISESQERMTLAVPAEKWDELSDLMRRRGVEATVIGEFTDSGRAIVTSAGREVMDLEMDFLHHGLPKKQLKTTYTRPVHEEPDLPLQKDWSDVLHALLGRLNIASTEFVVKQYDHEVQGGSVLKPMQGKGQVVANATVTKPVLDSEKALAVAFGINPSYSSIDTYHMAAAAIDTAVRNAVAVGADIERIVLMDNFCWCSSNDPERLGQLKAAAEACYDVATTYQTPFVSGKDSMFNDFNGFDVDGNPIKISIPPTLLVTAAGVMEAIKAVSLDAKRDGDLVYVLGETHAETGGSEYLALVGEQTRGSAYIGNSVPKVDAGRNLKLYSALSKAIQKELVASAQGVDKGGLAIALAKTAIGGKLGLDISLENLPGSYAREDQALFSESQGRLVVTVAPENKKRFEELLQGNAYAMVGTVTRDNLVVRGIQGDTIIDTGTSKMFHNYKETFTGY